MSRLEKNSPTVKLTEAQKRQLSEIDSEIDAKIAEKRVFLESEIAKAAGDEASVAELRRQLGSELVRLEEKREAKKEKVRNTER